MSNSMGERSLPSVRGFTLVELMIVLLVLSVVITLAVPGFDTLIKNNRLYVQSNQFYLALSRARNEAMSRVQRVTVCASSDQATCTGSWHQGWIMFTEDVASQNATYNPSDGDELLEKQEALRAGNTLKGETNVASYVSYAGTGFTALTDGSPQVGTLVLCDSRGLGFGRAIRINAAGRPRVSDTSGISNCDPTVSP